MINRSETVLIGDSLSSNPRPQNRSPRQGTPSCRPATPTSWMSGPPRVGAREQPVGGIVGIDRDRAGLGIGPCQAIARQIVGMKTGVGG